MATIPRFTAQRSLDTGGVIQYPSSSPLGESISRAGNTLEAIGARYKEMQDRKDTFDTTLREQELGQSIAQLEATTIQNAPADGTGIHDSVYGEMGMGGVARPGSFDTLFDSVKARVPKSKQGEFEAMREVYRLRGSNRMAQAQYGAQQDYYKVEIQKTQNDIVNSIMQMDPNDNDTFEAYKRNGLDIIDRSGLPALEKEVARANWEANAAIGLGENIIANDPEGANKLRGMLGFKTSVPKATVAADVQTRGQQALGFFMSRGYTKEQAAGIVGNLIAESDLRPSGAVGDNGTAFGIAQWRGERLTRLKRFAASQGKDWQDYGTQLAFVDMELQNHETSAYKALKNAKTVDEATAAFIGYERPAGWSTGNPRGGHNYRGRLANAAAMAGVEAVDLPSSADPRFAALTADQRQALANKADTAYGNYIKGQQAQAKADYTQYKDAVELQIVRGEIRDEEMVANDQTLNNGDKATLIRSLRTQNEGANQISADLTALSSNSLSLDPYASKDKTRADNLYSEVIKHVPPEQFGAVAGTILEQTGVVPQPVVNTIRRGLASDNVTEVVQAAQLAQRIATADPAALGRRDGGSEVQKVADDFTFYVNKLNLPTEEAARRIIDKNKPEAQFTRKAMEPAAKEFVKSLEGEDIGALFDDSVLGWRSNPAVGFNDAQRLGIQAEYVAIAEDQFYAVNGDAELAKNRAREEMKRLYGVTELTGSPTVMKHPPEKYWPKSTFRTTSGGLFRGADATLGYALTQLRDDIQTVVPDADLDAVQLITTPETDAMVKRGEMPGYAVLVRDRNGVYQTIPGKLWRPDFTGALKANEAEQSRTIDDARGEQGEERRSIEEMQAVPPFGRDAR